MTHLTAKDGYLGMLDHARSKGHMIRARYGPVFTRNSIHTLLQDREIVRYATRLVFDDALLEPGEPAHAVEVDDPEDRHFVLAVHPRFLHDAHAVACVVFYQLVRINYGPYATSEHAEALGSTALGVDDQVYYHWMCQLADALLEPV